MEPTSQKSQRHTRPSKEALVEMEKEHQQILEEEYDALAKEFWSTMGFEPF